MPFLVLRQQALQIALEIVVELPHLVDPDARHGSRFGGLQADPRVLERHLAGERRRFPLAQAEEFITVVGDVVGLFVQIGEQLLVPRLEGLDRRLGLLLIQAILPGELLEPSVPVANDLLGPT